MDATQKMLKELTEITGPSGSEHEVARAIEKHLKPYAKISHDRLGSVICKKEGSSERPRIMLAGHR